MNSPNVDQSPPHKEEADGPKKEGRYGWFFKNPVRETIRGFAVVGIWASVPTAIYGLYLFGAQVLGWMRTDFWAELPATSLFLGTTSYQEQEWLGWLLQPRGTLELGGFSSWLDSPQSWLGVHRVVAGSIEVFSIPVVFIGMACCLAMACGSVIAYIDRQRPVRTTGKVPQ